MNNQSYEDIINLPHHVSSRHPAMSMHDRAAQFSSFAALTGYEEMVAETARLTESRIIMDEQEMTELNRRLAELLEKSGTAPAVEIRYFIPDERKSGGRYLTVSGRMKKFVPDAGNLLMEDGTTIPFADIANLLIKDE